MEAGNVTLAPHKFRSCKKNVIFSTYLSFALFVPVLCLGRAPDADEYLREYLEGVRVPGVTHALNR